MRTLSLLFRLLTLALLLGLLGLWFAKRPALEALQESAAAGRGQLDLPADTTIPTVLRRSLAELEETRGRLVRRSQAAERLAEDNRGLRRERDTAETKARTTRQELRAARQGLAAAEDRAEAATTRATAVAAELEDERRARISLNREIQRLREDLLAAQRETADLRTRLAQVQAPKIRPAGTTGDRAESAPAAPRVEVVRFDRESGRVVLRRPPGPPLPAGAILTLRDGDDPVARLRLRQSHPRFLLLERPPGASLGLRLEEGSFFTLQR